MVGETWVLGQERAVQVAAVRGLVYGTLGAVLPVVAATDDALAERSTAGAKIRQAGVVLEGDDGADARNSAIHQHVADVALVARIGVRVEQADAGEVFGVERAVVFAE